MRDILMGIINAKTDKEKERLYRILEKVGMDRYTANVLIEELKKGGKNG